MPLRRAGLLLLCILLAATGALLLYMRSESGAPVPEPPRAREESPQAPSRLQSEPPAARASATEVPAAPHAALEPPEDLRAEGARRGWQLPLGKAWWTDTLINPKGVDPEAAALEVLQERVLSWCDRLLALKQARAKRLADYCQERIAAGLAVEDNAHDFPADGREHHWITLHTLAEPNRTLRVDIGPGDDGELDRLDRQVGSTWIEAVLDLRRRF